MKSKIWNILKNYEWPIGDGLYGSQAVTVIFRNQLQLVRLKTQQRHVVIAGPGRSGLLFAEAFRKAGQSVVVIEQNENNDQLENCLDVGALTLLGMREPRSF